MKRTIVIGDVHGCLEEFDELLKVVEYRPAQGDRLVLLGDLVDRGPDPVGVVRRARELKAESVMGNHEEKHLRYLRHEILVRERPGYKNPMKPFTEERMKQHKAYSTADLTWMAEMPIWLDLGNKWIAVHAGFEPGTHWTQQRAEKMLRIRYVGADGKMRMIHSDTDKPEGTSQWAAVYTEPIHVAYGHMALSTEEPALNAVQSFGQTWVRAAVDTACCFGGALSALLLDHKNINAIKTASVKAKATYAKIWQGGENE